MIRNFTLFLLFCLCSHHAHAQKAVKVFCQKLVKHTHIEGVEHIGDSDVPADIKPREGPVLGSISIPVEIDLAEYFDRSDLKIVQGINFESEVTNIEINQDGSVYYNGQEISGDIETLCTQPVAQDNNDPQAQPPPPSE